MSHPTSTSGERGASRQHERPDDATGGRPQAAHQSDMARRGGHDAHTESHGHSVAAWTGVGIIILGSLVGGVGVILAEVWLAALGIALMPVGGIVGWLMGKRSKDAAAHASSGPHGAHGSSSQSGR